MTLSLSELLSVLVLLNLEFWTRLLNHYVIWLLLNMVQVLGSEDIFRLIQNILNMFDKDTEDKSHA